MPVHRHRHTFEAKCLQLFSTACPRIQAMKILRIPIRWSTIIRMHHVVVVVHELWLSITVHIDSLTVTRNPAGFDRHSQSRLL